MPCKGWNSPGRPVVYAAATAALAVHEIRVHLDLDWDVWPDDDVLMAIDRDTLVPKGCSERPLDPRATGDAWIHRITVDPGQCGSRPCVRGLRIRVRDVLDLLTAGADRAEILADHPLLEDGDITAALE